MSEDKHGVYPRHREHAVVPSPTFPAIEEDILRYWRANDTFTKSVEMREAGERGANEFIFYDGPPFANGLPHYGHLLTGYVKDAIGRYQTQLGHRVERRFGWDTHGLPAELEAERILGIEDKSEIEGEDGMGIGAFNDACRSSVLRYTKEWEDYVTRQARWVDFDNDYKTLDLTFMESVIWAFKSLYDKGLAYEGYRVLPYCWNDQTPLSNHELKMDDDVYQDRQDRTVTVGVRLETGELALIWTTTPWTLPSNLAIAVGPEIDYVVVAPTEGVLAGERVILAEALVSAYAKELGEDVPVSERLKGADLVGRRYHPIFDYFASRDADDAPGPNAFTILAGDFVTTEDGTGLVHMAPAFGEDDMIACTEAGIRPVVPVDDAGKFTADVPDYVGQQVFDANRAIITDLRDATGPIGARPEAQRPVLVRDASYVHPYPHCWRCREPLIYRAVSSWFVAVTKFRDRMVELNQEIAWVPEHIKDGQFGKWLEGARDWSISRNRYWGSPIPVWVSDNPAYPRTDVYGSIAELEADFGVEVTDLHRPFIDTLVRPNPDDPTGTSMMRRIPDVLDCWFESGSMPYAQVHYPFENADWFDSHFPGDFIVEYIGQTRGWFYTLHVLSTALFDRPAFTSAISHGIVLGSDGRKMSKSLRNYPDVSEVFDRDGADAMRWFLLSSPVVRGGNLVVTEEGIRAAVREALLPAWSAWYFFALYAGAYHGQHGYEASFRTDSPEVLDRYLMAKTGDLVREVRAALDAYDIPGATEAIRTYVDTLTNWYIRESRGRFWNDDDAAFDTLYTALKTLCEVAAPLLPMVTEEIWRGLTGGESVHLQDYPDAALFPVDEDLVAATDEARAVISGAHALRKAEKIRVRQPLGTLRVVSTNPERLAPFADLIASEINVKHVDLQDVATCGLQVRESVAVQPRELAPEMRRLTSQLFAAAKSGAFELAGDTLRLTLADGSTVDLAAGQYTLSQSVETEAGEAASVLSGGTVVVLDTMITDELAAEGIARDVIRAVQQARKDAGLHVSDRISARLALPADQLAAIEAYRDLVCAETLATELTLAEGEADIQVAKADA
ncbi:isoleucine--tRNA ligase [Bowdeniella nasicola]|uniref:Isoleucine--tRNA ligase n=1 Tax=Bowdeniella nasicola TaxID=208480 RepID=A0A1Q5Q1C6_9ACTO|nr:isoleucine--tRNA ligase [Bowdeniella nasicola]OKL53410.1 isoleucine--tRNA ligase [Bowdeniella nasicola]